jgi:S-DNA-T family DNA segregation ATPase FtsK/SpoIIIE
MAKKIKPAVKKASKPENDSTLFTLSSDKKKKIWGLFLIVFSLVIFLSLLTYSRKDENLTIDYSLKETLGFIFNGHEKQSINNWIGIFGVFISKYLMKSLIGYFSFVFPLITILFGVSFFRPISFKTKLNVTNFLLFWGILSAGFFGVLRMKLGILFDRYELSGAVGEYIGSSLGMLLGSIGSLLLIITLMIISLVIAFDIKIEKFFHWLKSLFSSSVEYAQDKLNGKDEVETEKDEKSEDNLDKIKSLREKNKKKDPPNVQDESVLPEDKKDTTIRILRKNELQENEKNSAIPDELKNVKVSDEKIQKKKGEKAKVQVEEFPPEQPGGVVPKADTIEDVIEIREKEVEKPDPWEEKIKYNRLTLEILDPIPQEDFKVAEDELKRNAELLKEKLALFDIEIEDISVTPGPVVTLYEIKPAPGVKISKIVSLENDIALALAARGIRIIAPIPGKSAIGVEIPNLNASLVVAKSVLGTVSASKFELPLAFGKTIAGDVYLTDLAKMPHMLIAGSTGSGKSVGINMIITSLLYAKHPSEVKLAIIDPKKIELSFYKSLRRHYLAVSPDLDEEIVTVPQNAILLLKSVEYEMEQRYDRLAKAGVRNIVDYNQKVSDPSRKPKDDERIKHHFLPYIVVIIDELADLMITAGKEVEEPIARLAQLARAVGIHLVVATQRPSVNVITGVIKANFSARIAYQVATKIDSRTILDMNGAEQLLGRGDMLYLPTGTPKPIRIQNAFITTDEVERITQYIQKQEGYSKPYYLPSLYDKKKDAGAKFLEYLDPLFEDAARVIVKYQQGSVSLLQRRLKLGYSRAARIVDQLEEAGIVGPNDGSKAREVMVENEEQLETILRNI